MQHVDPNEIGIYLRAGGHALDLFKKLRDMWPAKSQERVQIEAKIVEAEDALKLSEANLAKALGYNLCQCTFPPKIMLSKGRHPTHDNEIFKCDGCGKQEPSEAHFRDLGSGPIKLLADIQSG